MTLINRRSIQLPISLHGMEGSTVRFDALYVRYRPEKGMIKIARRETLGPGGNNERAEAVSHSPGTPFIQRTEKKGNCSDCNRGTHLLWSTGPIDYRLCQACAKRRGPPYRHAITVFLKAIHV